jgi:hypothetical protein
MKLHNVHRVMLVAVVAVVLKPFHALPDEQRPFRTAAILLKKSVTCCLDKQIDVHGWFEDDVD